MFDEIVQRIAQETGGSRRPKCKPDSVRTIRDVTNVNLRLAQMSALGFKNVEIADALGLTPASVNMNKRSPVTKAMISHLQGNMVQESETVNKKIQNLLPKCVEIFEDLLNDEELHPSLKLKTASHVMSVGGYGPSKNLNVQTSQGLTDEQLDRVLERARQLNMTRLPDVVDVEEGEVVDDKS